jgi:hypothetical protein
MAALICFLLMFVFPLEPTWARSRVVPVGAMNFALQPTIIQGPKEFYPLLAEAGPAIGLGFAEIAAISIQASPYLRRGHLFGVQWDEKRNGVKLLPVDFPVLLARDSSIFIGSKAPESLKSDVAGLTWQLRNFAHLETIEDGLNRFFEGSKLPEPNEGKILRKVPVEPVLPRRSRKELLVLAEAERKNLIDRWVNNTGLQALAAEVGVTPTQYRSMGILEIIETRDRIMLMEQWAKDPGRARLLEEAGISTEQFKKMPLAQMRKTIHKLGFLLKW